MGCRGGKVKNCIRLGCRIFKRDKDRDVELLTNGFCFCDVGIIQPRYRKPCRLIGWKMGILTIEPAPKMTMGRGVLAWASFAEWRPLPSLASFACGRLTAQQFFDLFFVGIAGAVPGRVTEIDAVAQPNRTASSGDLPSERAVANPPLKASPHLLFPQPVQR